MFEFKRVNQPQVTADVHQGNGLTKIVVWFPVDKHHLLDQHVRALGSTISARARELLIADIAAAKAAAQ